MIAPRDHTLWYSTLPLLAPPCPLSAHPPLSRKLRASANHQKTDSFLTSRASTLCRRNNAWDGRSAPFSAVSTVHLQWMENEWMNRAIVPPTVFETARGSILDTKGYLLHSPHSRSRRCVYERRKIQRHLRIFSHTPVHTGDVHILLSELVGTLLSTTSYLELSIQLTYRQSFAQTQRHTIN